MSGIRKMKDMLVKGIKNPERIRPYIFKGPPIFYYKQILSVTQTIKYATEFSEVQNYCLFIGHGRSGHSLVGSLLNAHPEMVIAHELDALGFLRTSLPLSQQHLFSLILQRDKNFTGLGRDWEHYNYNITDAEYQGKYDTLRVVGDKQGGKTSRRLKRNPELLTELEETIDVPICMINVVRNPFDNIASMNKRWEMKTEDAIDRYFRKVDTIQTVSERLSDDEFYRLTYENLIADTKHELSELCTFLDVEPPESYLDICESFVFDSSKKTRTEIEWTDDQIQAVEERLDDYPWLRQYTY